MKRYELAIAVWLAFFGLAAAFGQTAAPKTGLTANLVFQKNCAKCHGKTAEGRHLGGPTLLSPKTGDLSAQQLHDVIANGKGRIPKFDMPKFGKKLASQEIDILVQQIQALNKK